MKPNGSLLHIQYKNDDDYDDNIDFIVGKSFMRKIIVILT